MENVFEYLRQLNMASMMLRIVLAAVMGGLLGLERERKSSPAGFRTYMLVAIGSTVTMLLSQYIDLMLSTQWQAQAQAMGAQHDVSRFGAQVINGVGFLGAGTIILTGRTRVKGLTTAAGLWASAIVGLACGMGFVECAVFATLVILLAETVLVKFEYRFAKSGMLSTLYVEYANAEGIEPVLALLAREGARVAHLEISKTSGEGDGQRCCAIISLQLTAGQSGAELANGIAELGDVITVEEL